MEETSWRHEVIDSTLGVEKERNLSVQQVSIESISVVTSLCIQSFFDKLRALTATENKIKSTAKFESLKFHFAKTKLSTWCGSNLSMILNTMMNYPQVPLHLESLFEVNIYLKAEPTMVKM